MRFVLYFMLTLIPCAAIGLASPFGSAQEPAKKDSEVLVAVNTSGKELAFKKWKVIQGTRIIVAPAPRLKSSDGKEEEPAPTPTRQEFLEFREDNSTTYEEGILTLIPLKSLKRIEYTNEEKTKTEPAKKLVAVTFEGPDGKDVVLSGTTRYTGINKLIIDGSVDVGDLGPPTVRLAGGMLNAKPAIKSFRFPASQPVARPDGPFSVIDGVDKDRTKFKVQDLKALYRVKGVGHISSDLIFKKDAKIDVATIVKLRKAAPEKGKKAAPLEWEVTLADGKQLDLLLVKDVFPDTGAPAQFQGLIGKVDAGYKVFPLHTLSEMRKAP